MLSDDDYEEFRCTIRDAGYSPGDFEISTADAGDKQDMLHIAMTNVLVKYLPTEVTKTYQAGFGDYWLSALEKDLREGFYNRKR